jgi:hypothetical protein
VRKSSQRSDPVFTFKLTSNKAVAQIIVGDKVVGTITETPDRKRTLYVVLVPALHSKVGTGVTLSDKASIKPYLTRVLGK